MNEFTRLRMNVNSSGSRLSISRKARSSGVSMSVWLPVNAIRPTPARRADWSSFRGLAFGLVGTVMAVLVLLPLPHQHGSLDPAYPWPWPGSVPAHCWRPCHPARPGCLCTAKRAAAGAIAPERCCARPAAESGPAFLARCHMPGACYPAGDRALGHGHQANAFTQHIPDRSGAAARRNRTHPAGRRARLPTCARQARLPSEYSFPRTFAQLCRDGFGVLPLPAFRLDACRNRIGVSAWP